MLQLIEKSTTLPVSLATVKSFLKVEDTTDDTLITSLIHAATEYLEQATDRDIYTRTWKEVFPQFPQRIEPLKTPVSQITEISYYDGANTEQTTTAFYFVNSTNLRGLIYPQTTWPSTYSRPDAVTVEYETEYAVLPELLKQAILLLVAHWYEHREAEVVGTITKAMDIGLDRIIQLLRV